MIRNIIRIALWLALAVIFFCLQFIAKIAAPPPLNFINFIFILVLLLVTFYSRWRVLWPLALLAFCAELFNATAFGAVSAAVFLSCLSVHWLTVNVLTSRSVPIIFLSAATGALVYRLVFFTVFLLSGVAAGNFYVPPGAEFLRQTLEEILFTAIAAALLYFFVVCGVRKLYPKFVHSRRF